MRTDLERLQGSWKVISLETDGQRADPSMHADARIVITGKTFTSLGMGAPFEGDVTLHRAGKHQALDLLFTGGHAAGTTHLAIYKIDDDTWTLCLSMQSAKRPAGFSTKPGSGFVLEVLEREKGKIGKVRLKPDATGETNAPLKPDATGDTNVRLKPDATGKNVLDAAPSGQATEIEGEWAMVSAVFDGKPMADDMVAWCKRITRGNVTTVIAGPQTMMKATFTLDGSKKLAAIDYVNLHGSAKGKAQAGIYELAGDSLQICMAPPGQPRPKTFESHPKDGRSYTTWRKSAR